MSSSSSSSAGSSSSSSSSTFDESPRSREPSDSQDEQSGKDVKHGKGTRKELNVDDEEVLSEGEYERELRSIFLDPPNPVQHVAAV